MTKGGSGVTLCWCCVLNVLLDLAEGSGGEKPKKKKNNRPLTNTCTPIAYWLSWFPGRWNVFILITTVSLSKELLIQSKENPVLQELKNSVSVKEVLHLCTTVSNAPPGFTTCTNLHFKPLFNITNRNRWSFCTGFSADPLLLSLSAPFGASLSRWDRYF